MAVPARKTSKTRKALRRTHFKLAASTLLNATITKTDSGVQVEAGASKLGHAASTRVLKFA